MKKRTGRKPKRPEKNFFETIYYNESITAKDLAKTFNVSEQTIYNWAYQYRKNTKCSKK